MACGETETFDDWDEAESLETAIAGAAKPASPKLSASATSAVLIREGCLVNVFPLRVY